MREGETQLQELQRELKTLKLEVSRLTEGGRQSQLPFASVDNAFVPFRDGNQIDRLIFGKQTDGVWAVKYVNGTKPATPTIPVVGGQQLSIAVAWDGTFVGGIKPSDVQRIDVHVSDTSGFTPDGTTAKISMLGEGVVSIFADIGTKYVKLVAVTHADVASDPTEEVAIEPLPADELAAGSVTSNTLASLLVLAGTILAGDPVGGRVELGFGTGDLSSMVGINARGSDGQTITFLIDALTGNVFVKGRVEFGSGSIIEDDYVELVEQLVGVSEPDLRQSGFFKSHAGSISGSWPLDTAPGNLLLAYVCAEDSGFSVFPTITPPVGWTPITSATTDDDTRLSLYYIEDAPVRTSESFTFDVTSYATMGLFEYTGIATTAALDRVASASGQSGTISTGTTPLTTQAEELWFAVGGEDFGQLSLTDPSDFFVQLGEVYSPSGSSESQGEFPEGDQTSSRVATRIVTTTGTATTSWNFPSGRVVSWAGIVATFKARTTGGDPLPTSPSTVRMYAKERSGETELFTINDGGVVRVLGNDTTLLDEVEFTGVESGIIFSSIDQNYRDLLIKMRADKTNDPGGFRFRSITLQFNGDAGPNYHDIWYRFRGGGTIEAFDHDDSTFMEIGTVGDNASGTDINIRGYSRTDPIVIADGISYARFGALGDSKCRALHGGRWTGTGPITSLEFALFAGDFTAFSGVQLWGVGKIG